MNRLIRRLTSLDNLSPFRNQRGQIATVLIVSTVALLVFALVTLNIGNASISSTSVANAADAGALKLGSLCATQSRAIWNSLEQSTESCEDTGWASFIVAIVIAIIAIILVVFCPALGGVGWAALTSFASATSAIAGAGLTTLAIAGAVGGAIGGGITGAATGQNGGWAGGALAGAQIGAAVGCLAAGGAQGLSGSTTGSTTVGGQSLNLGTYEMAVPGTSTIVTVSPSLYIPEVAIPISQSTAGFLGAGMSSTGLTLSGVSVNDANKSTSQAQEQFGQMLANMADRDRFRESVIMDVINRLADDPNMSADVVDSDADGLASTENVSDVQIWLFNRFTLLDQIQDAIGANGIVKSFLDNYAERFQRFCTLVNEGGENWDYIAGHPEFLAEPGPLERAEYSITTVPAPTAEHPEAVNYVAVAGRDGHIVQLIRALRNSGRPVTFFQPGPAFGAMNNWMSTCTGTCVDPPPAGYDALDNLADNLREQREIIQAIRSLPENDSIEAYKGWIFFFYDEDNPDNMGTMHGRLRSYITQVVNWGTEIENIRRTLPTCLTAIDPSGVETITNAPCRYTDEYGGSIDSDFDDEFSTVAMELLGLEMEMRQFDESGILGHFSLLTSPDVDPLADQICVQPGESNPSGKPCGGKNPATYEWTDSRGDHKIKIQTKFNVPSTHTENRGSWWDGEVCVVMDYGWDSASNPCEVIVSRYDQRKGMGDMGDWNPWGGWVTKAARAAFRWDYVRLRNHY